SDSTDSYTCLTEVSYLQYNEDGSYSFFINFTKKSDRMHGYVVDVNDNYLKTRKIYVRMGDTVFVDPCNLKDRLPKHWIERGDWK
ncbi:hypothetical protein OAH12_01830, partial [Cyclobacteriaceae bacterium]|nr:hypothetical protein [Cyclobacteriaceae bacterium]